MNNHYAQAVVAAEGAPLDGPVYERCRRTSCCCRASMGSWRRVVRISVPDYGGDITYGVIRATPEREKWEYLLLSYAYQFDYPPLGIYAHADDQRVLRGRCI